MNNQGACQQWRHSSSGYGNDSIRRGLRSLITVKLKLSLLKLKLESKMKEPNIHLWHNLHEMFLVGHRMDEGQEEFEGSG